MENWHGIFLVHQFDIVDDEIVCEVLDRYLEEARVKIEKIMGDCLSRFLTTIKGSAEAKISEYWKK